jgi:hypothetical protein
MHLLMATVTLTPPFLLLGVRMQIALIHQVWSYLVTAARDIMHQPIYLGHGDIWGLLRALADITAMALQLELRKGNKHVNN